MMTNFEFPTINYDVVIVGGGISGLTLACGLRSRSVSVPLRGSKLARASRREGESSGLRILVVEAQQQKKDLGSLAVLKRYDRWRRYENWVILAFTDILNRSFSNHWLPMVRLRRLLLRLIIYWSFLRRLLLRLMTGLWGRQPQLDAQSAEKVPNGKGSVKHIASDRSSSAALQNINMN